DRFLRLSPNPANFHDSGLLPAAFPHGTNSKTGQKLSSLLPSRFRHTLVASTLSRVWHGKARSQARPRRLSATGPSPGARQTRAHPAESEDLHPASRTSLPPPSLCPGPCESARGFRGLSFPNRSRQVPPSFAQYFPRGQSAVGRLRKAPS